MTAFWINFISAVCLAYLAALLIITICRFVLSDRGRRYAFLKGFKKGSCFLVYFAAIPMFLIAYLNGGYGAGESVFYSIKSATELVVLKYDFSVFSALMSSYVLFNVTVYFCYTLVLANAVLFAFSVLGMRLLNVICKTAASRQREEVFIVVGYNKNNGYIIDSVKKRGKRAILFADETAARDKDAIRNFMYTNGTGYAACTPENFARLLEKYAVKNSKTKAVNVIINTGSDEQNLLLTKTLSEVVSKDGAKRSLFSRVGINGYVFCEPKNVSAFNCIVEATHGAIQYVNKYRMVSMDFIFNYPLTKYMTDELDGQYPALKANTEVNFIMIGFGKLCRQLFHTSVSSQQFISVENGRIKEKPVHYCIYDKDNSNADVNLNHNYYRYADFLQQHAGEEDKYLPFAPAPADVRFHKLNVSDGGFYKSLREDMSGEGKYSYAVISFGTDMQNLDLARKLSAKIDEWGLRPQVKLFVKIRDGRLTDGLRKDGVIFFGDESKVVYNVESIMHENIENMAKKRHLSYTGEYESGKSQEEIGAIARGKWFDENSQCQREANIYACLSLRSRLNMLGFDFKPKGGGKTDAAERFAGLYQSDDEIKYGGQLADGRKKIIYKNDDFNKLSVRKACAVLEHQRWNANYLSWGFVPASIEEITSDTKNGGKNFALRRHGCLTTFDGLERFRQIRSCSTGKTEEQTDVIRYDYQLMDEAEWLLSYGGYEICPAENAAK